MMQWLILALAIVAEVVATSMLKASDGFTRVGPSVIVALGYGISFYCLSLTVRVMPIGVVYAIWSGVGVTLITLFAWLFYKQVLDVPAILGMSLIVAGVIVLNMFSRSIGH
ncbi:multidrug efflux SMR transporter [Undibacterium sp.]|jgi:small multidrug resistance pump|uniref:DMT family transporter n=1 Tax=Undibacterium sp. TaxID=1914977 RepID=UPI002CFE4C64|nr:multidrug efflux SMR transporter [Undibacterium sp.]HTD06567.1 multidrug efflux SMR transporter [Undibacterium sp.]